MTYLRDLYVGRELLWFFIWRDVLVRYKHAFLGIFWALIRPLLNMAFFVVVFQKIAQLQSEAPYFLLVLAGLIPWQFMASNIQSSAVSLLQNTVLIQKAAFPRLYLPTSTVLVNFLDCLVSLAVFIPCTVIFYHLPIQSFCFPLFLLLNFLQCLALSFWFSALTVRYKDITIVLPYVIQLGILATPVGYASDLFPHFLFLLNPLVGVIDGYRWSLLGESARWMGFTVPYSIGMTALVLGAGVIYFRSVERYLADEI